MRTFIEYFKSSSRVYQNVIRLVKQMEKTTREASILNIILKYGKRLKTLIVISELNRFRCSSSVDDGALKHYDGNIAVFTIEGQLIVQVVNDVILNPLQWCHDLNIVQGHLNCNRISENGGFMVAIGGRKDRNSGIGQYVALDKLKDNLGNGCL